LVPFRVTVILDIILALAEGIPKFNRPVARTGNNLTVISAEADRKDIRGMADEATGGQASIEIPETEGVVPRRREGELAIGRDYDVGNEMVVSL
jgi:hypothetical protein